MRIFVQMTPSNLVMIKMIVWMFAAVACAVKTHNRIVSSVQIVLEHAKRAQANRLIVQAHMGIAIVKQVHLVCVMASVLWMV